MVKVWRRNWRVVWCTWKMNCHRGSASCSAQTPTRPRKATTNASPDPILAIPNYWLTTVRNVSMLNMLANSVPLTIDVSFVQCTCEHTKPSFIMQRLVRSWLFNINLSTGIQWCKSSSWKGSWHTCHQEKLVTEKSFFFYYYQFRNENKMELYETKKKLWKKPTGRFIMYRKKLVFQVFESWCLHNYWKFSIFKFVFNLLKLKFCKCL